MEELEQGKYEAPTVFVRSDHSFSFPYGFKHGTVLSITDNEYERLKAFRKSPGLR